MRWPLRNQVLVPMVCLMIGTLIGVSVLNAYFSLRHARSQIAADLRQVAVTLADSNFPLTDGVLRDMQGLSGAEFVLTNRRGRVLESSGLHLAHVDLPNEQVLAATTDPAFGEPIVVDGRQFFHVPMDVRSVRASDEESVLHILYPKEAYDAAWRVAVYPPMVLGIVAVVLVVVVARTIASRVTRPLRVLQSQVDEIAEGRFRPLPAPSRDDELADLSRCINRMSEMLVRYEDKVRHNEQLRTLGQLGGGIAHQMRNSVTGCRMAVDLHARECQSGSDDQALQVAVRQLELTERHLQRFLSLGRRDPKPQVKLDLLHVVTNVIDLVDTNARHLGVELKHEIPDESVFVCGDEDALAQLLTNLTLNAIEAAAATRAAVSSDRPLVTNAGEDRDQDSPREVTLLLRPADQRARLTVQDTGAGPSRDLGESLFEPFVTEKPDGTGLGLFVARQIAQSHGGEIHWERCGATTCFVVDLPLFETERDCV